MQKQVAGYGLLLFALSLLLVNLSDTVADLRDWHSASTPMFIAQLMKQLGAVVMAALGGKLLPAPNGVKP